MDEDGEEEGVILQKTLLFEYKNFKKNNPNLKILY